MTTLTIIGAGALAIAGVTFAFVMGWLSARIEHEREQRLGRS